ncbi:Transcriptional regulator, contains HTH domain [Halanaeroarchaeum sp. HSR-CO]|uniref:helix-turn-helix transcriptional regulator n=1 Tax=Halanaeroarchaeum sp. HSR-CO TaxID=2866382 RepID=UPI00217DC8A0|nr:HTH domain-containing protein [Halanaeroarchaeum sp. HSR-CO]UWG47627.1 Transcriptional regulator, contains HTH domain [Halanaeroarchaeum sp. HSR-CO]
MMGCDDVECLIGLLSRRYDLLEALTDDPRTKNELESSLGVSRSTIDRAVRSLEEESIVVRGMDGVRLTLLGRIALDGYRQFRTGLEGLDLARPLVSSQESDEKIPFELFERADIINANRQSPHRPIVGLQQFLEDASTVKSIATALLPEYVEFYHNQVVDHEMDVELVVLSSVLDELLATYWESMNDALSTGRLTIFETSAEPPYSLKIGETDTTEVSIVTYGDQGVTGFIRSESRVAVEWAQELYQRTKANATLVAPMD